MRGVLGRIDWTVVRAAMDGATSTDGIDSTILHSSDEAVVTMTVWPPMTSTSVADGGGADSIVLVVAGSLAVTWFTEVGGEPAVTGFTSHGRGELVHLDGDRARLLANAGPEPLVTLTIAAPPPEAVRIRLDEDPSSGPPDDDGLEPDDPPAGAGDAAKVAGGDAAKPSPDGPDRRDRVSMRLRTAGPVGRLADRFVTLVSGIAPSDARPWFVWTRPTFYAVVLLWLLLGAASTAAVLTMGPVWMWPVAIVSMVVTASGARAGMITVMHDAIHGWWESRDPRTKRRFWWIGTLMSSLLLVLDFETYAADHGRHHGSDFATPKDPDVALLMGLRFRPGMTVEALRRHFRRLRWSPWFHWVYLKARLASQFASGPLLRRALVGGTWAAVLGGLAWMGAAALAVFLVAWVYPLTIMFQQAALEQFLGEHRWLKEPDRDADGVTRYRELTSDRFALDEPPRTAGMGPVRRTVAWFRGWVRWWIRLVFVHAEYRARIVWGDLAHHREHHDHGLVTLDRRGVELPRYARRDIAWMNTAYGRRVYERLRAEGDPEPTAFWSRDEPLEATFRVWADLDPTEVGEPADDVELRSGMLGM